MASAKNYDYNFIKNEILEICKTLNKIPTWKEIRTNKEIPHHRILKKIFINYKRGYQEFCEQNGYKVKRKKSKISKYEYWTYQDLVNLWDSFYKKHNHYPTGEEYHTHKHGLPNLRDIKKICGNKFEKFKEKYKISKAVKTKPYKKYCEIFINICKNEDRILTTLELGRKNKYSGILPNAQWFIKNCPDKNIKTYNDFIKYLKLESPYEVSKEDVIKIILKKSKKLNRSLKCRDFTNIKKDEVGIKIIKKYWGSFNNMLKELKLPINHENGKHKTLEEMKNDIIKLGNYIKENEGRNYIDYNDVNNCKWCSHSETYNKYFKEYLNKYLGEFIESIGFVSKVGTLGKFFMFDDGEKTVSKHEYIVSNYLREKNIKYNRNILYRKFIKNYQGKMNCDYVIDLNNKVWYVEVAGMLDYTRGKIKDNYIMENYRCKLKAKEKMLEENNLNYKIIYPTDLENPLDGVFSFIKIQELK